MASASIETTQFRSTVVATNGVRLHVVQAGPEDGPLVLLLHGFPEFWYAWRRVIPYLAARGYFVWAPDQRGYNLSDKPLERRAYRSHLLLNDLVGLIDAARRQRATVVGHDWGGIVAWWLAERHADRLHAAVILNAPHPTVFQKHLLKSPRQILRSSYAAFFQLPGLPEVLLRRSNFRLLKQSLRRSSREGTFSETELQKYCETWGQPGALTGMLNWYRGARPHRRGGTGRIAVPLQLLWGRRDRFLGAELAERSLALCETGELVYFPEATHWLHHEEPDRINASLEAFLRKTHSQSVWATSGMDSRRNERESR